MQGHTGGVALGNSSEHQTPAHAVPLIPRVSAPGTVCQGAQPAWPEAVFASCNELLGGSGP